MWLCWKGVQVRRVTYLYKMVGAHEKDNYRISGSPLMDGILALDPAGPVFEDNAISRLDRNDAKAVQVLHTDTDTFGYE